MWECEDKLEGKDRERERERDASHCFVKSLVLEFCYIISL